MADDRACGCKGIRSCLICEEKLSIYQLSTDKPKSQTTVYIYCIECSLAFEEKFSAHPHHQHEQGNSLLFGGIDIIPDFVSNEEEEYLLGQIYKAPFVVSQSGRQKQDFGPKVNFKKKKLRADKFSGLPAYARFVYNRMKNVRLLEDFLPVELCNLEYASDRGAAIDPHFDDFWIWGERLVTLNLMSDSVLFFTSDSLKDIEVHVPMQRRSLIVVSGDARNAWKHGIHRRHIRGKRLAMTLRELTPEFLEGDRKSEGKSLLDIALKFEGASVAEL